MESREPKNLALTLRIGRLEKQLQAKREEYAREEVNLTASEGAAEYRKENALHTLEQAIARLANELDQAQQQQTINRSNALQ